MFKVQKYKNICSYKVDWSQKWNIHLLVEDFTEIKKAVEVISCNKIFDYHSLEGIWFKQFFWIFCINIIAVIDRSAKQLRQNIIKILIIYKKLIWLQKRNI
jgi:hypothetical protein